MSNNFIDVHTFDGKLQGLFTPSRIYTVDEKKTAFYNLTTLLADLNAIDATKTMIKDLVDDKVSNNFHPANNLDASDILIEILQWVNNPYVLKSLNEQLSDAKNLGLCNSGRVTRLLQIWLAFLDSSKIKS